MENTQKKIKSTRRKKGITIYCNLNDTNQSCKFADKAKLK